MDLPVIFAISQLVLSVLLITAILFQQRGTGLGSAFGGGDENVFSTRRGAERAIFTSTIIFAILFFAVGIAQVLFL